MSADAHILQALASRTKKSGDLRYFEIITVKLERAVGILGGEDTRKPRRAYLCVGRHEVSFIKLDLSQPIRGGVIRYAWIDRVIVDTDTRQDLMLVLGASRVGATDLEQRDSPDRVRLRSENRADLLRYLEVCFLADSMSRQNKIQSFPRADATDTDRPVGPLTAQPVQVWPFQGYKQIAFHNYGLFVRDSFKKVTETQHVGTYANDVVNLEVHSYEPVHISHLGQVAREHVRWLAMEYKQALIDQHHAKLDVKTTVSKDQMYLKKMNLSNDTAAWICWEVMLNCWDERTSTRTATALMVLRRQYMPPMMDTVQDFAIILRCEGGRSGAEEDLRHQAHLAADSFGPLVQSPCLYQHIIQTKLDALLFDEDAYGWIKCRLKMTPQGGLEKYGYLFCKGILKILKDENALSDLDLWDEVCARVSQLCDKKGEQDLDPMFVVKKLEQPADGLMTSNTDSAGSATAATGGGGDRDIQCSLNAWRMRVAQYLTFCLDGGLFGSKITIGTIVSNMSKDTCSKDAEVKFAEILTFLLHLRPLDMSIKYLPEAMEAHLERNGLLHSKEQKKDQAPQPCLFNDRVMQALLEMGYILALLPPSDMEAQPGTFSRPYGRLLSNLLTCSAATVNLKASICRQIVAARYMEGKGLNLSIGLVALLEEGNLFLKTYACAALVNLSQTEDTVKNLLIENRIASLSLELLKSRDDDLVLYTLMLLTNLSKLVHHREALIRTDGDPRKDDLISVLYDILKNAYDVIEIPQKRRIFTELCAVMGQMANDDENRVKMNEAFPKPVREMLVQAIEDEKAKLAPPGANPMAPSPRASGSDLPAASVKMLSKVSFAVKQLCGTSERDKEAVGRKVIKPMMLDLTNANNLRHREWVTNAVGLLMALAINRVCCDLIREHWDFLEKHSVKRPYVKPLLQKSEVSSLDVVRDRMNAIDHLLEKGDPRTMPSKDGN